MSPSPASPREVMELDVVQQTDEEAASAHPSETSAEEDGASRADIDRPQPSESDIYDLFKVMDSEIIDNLFKDKSTGDEFDFKPVQALHDYLVWVSNDRKTAQEQIRQLKEKIRELESKCTSLEEQNRDLEPKYASLLTTYRAMESRANHLHEQTVLLEAARDAATLDQSVTHQQNNRLAAKVIEAEGAVRDAESHRQAIKRQNHDIEGPSYAGG